MSDKTELRGEVAKLERIHAALALLTDRTDSGRKMELVNLRRELATQISAISNVAEKGFLVSADNHVVREFRNALSAMRRAVALHQANFPAVALDDQSADYSVSVKAVREANTGFMQWVSANL